MRRLAALAGGGAAAAGAWGSRRRRFVACAGGASSPSQAFELGYVTDIEGNLDYWRRYVERSGVLRYSAAGGLELTHAGAHFVYGGDVVDKGPGDIRLARELVALKARYPDRVWLLVGNRDLNKLRFAAELGPKDLARPPESIPGPHWDPKIPTLARHLAQVAEAEGRAVRDVDTRKGRLKWMLLHTLGCADTFEHRRRELGELRGLEFERVSDDEVVESMLREVRPGGSLWEYLCAADVAAVVGNTLFVHGAVDRRNMGFIPNMSTRFELPTKPQPGRDLGGESVQRWVEEFNAFLRAGLADHLERPEWDETRATRGGEQLLAMQNRAAMWGRTVVSNCYSDGGVITSQAAASEGEERIKRADETADALLFEGVCSDPRDGAVASWLRLSGIDRVVVGHKPSGDSPAVLSAEYTGVEFVSADTSFSAGARGRPGDPRGCAIAALTILGRRDANQVLLHGILGDGREYETLLPLLPRSAASDDVESGDDLVGTELAGGWWVKAKLAGEDYHLCRGSGRSVEYRSASVRNGKFVAARL